MFDLDQAIREWRQQMLAAGIKSPVPLDELEGHLRDDVAQRRRAASDVEGAFMAAVQGIGQPKALHAEFAKTAALKEARERKLKLLCLAATALVYLTPFALSGAKPWHHMNLAEQWLGLAALALTVVSVFSGLLFHRFLPVIPDKRVRTRVQFASSIPLFVWLCVFVFVLVPRVEWTVAQLSVATLWAISPLAIFGGLICGLDEAACRRAHEISARTSLSAS